MKITIIRSRATFGIGPARHPLQDAVIVLPDETWVQVVAILESHDGMVLELACEAGSGPPPPPPKIEREG